MPTKFTMLFQHTSAASAAGPPIRRIGGWSESWYHPATDLQTVLAAAGAPIFAGFGAVFGAGLMPARAGLLGLGAGIVGYRVQNVSPIGPAQSGACNYPGIAGNLSDIPQMALLCKAPGVGVLNIRRFTLRGVVDKQVIEGEWSPDGPTIAAFATFQQALKGWAFRGRDLSQTTYEVVSVTSGGLATLTATPVWAVGDRIRFLRVEQEDGTVTGQVATVTQVGPLVGQAQLSGWSLGLVEGGQARKDGLVFPLVDSGSVALSRVVTRRVGRPFVGYRGRRSKRR